MVVASEVSAFPEYGMGSWDGGSPLISAVLEDGLTFNVPELGSPTISSYNSTSMSELLSMSE